MVDRFDGGIELKQNGISHGVGDAATHIINGTTLILLFGVIIAAIISMAEISLNFSAVIDISLLCAILFMVASLIYTSRYSGGVYRAKQSSAYLDALTEYNATKELIYTLGLSTRLPELCQQYREAELMNYRAAVLSDACISYEQYEAKYRGKSKKDLKAMNLQVNAIKVIMRANNAKSVKLSAEDLISIKTNRLLWLRPSALPRSPESKQRVDIALNTLSRAATTVLAGAVAVDVIFEFSWLALAQWAVRMLPLVWAAIKGERDGENNVNFTTIPFLVKQTEILKHLVELSEKTPPEMPGKKLTNF